MEDDLYSRHLPPPTSGLGRADYRDYVTVEDLLAISHISQNTRRPFTSPGEDVMQAQVKTVNMAVTDFLTRQDSQKSRSAPGALKDWAEQIQNLGIDLQASLGAGSGHIAELDARRTLLNPISRSVGTELDSLRARLFRCTPADYQKACKAGNSLTDVAVLKETEAILARLLAQLELLSWLAGLAGEKAAREMSKPGGSPLDHDRRLLMARLLPVYKKLSGRAASGSNPRGPSVRWFRALFDLLRQQAAQASEQSHPRSRTVPLAFRGLPTKDRTVASWIEDAKQWTKIYPAHVRIRKSSGEMMRKLSVTLSQ